MTLRMLINPIIPYCVNSSTTNPHSSTTNPQKIVQWHIAQTQTIGVPYKLETTYCEPYPNHPLEIALLFGCFTQHQFYPNNTINPNSPADGIEGNSTYQTRNHIQHINSKKHEPKTACILHETQLHSGTIT